MSSDVVGAVVSFWDPSGMVSVKFSVLVTLLF